MFTTTYWVLREADEMTVAICPDAAAANWICENYPEKCIIRITIKRG